MKKVFYIKGRPSTYAYPAVSADRPDSERLILFDGQRKGPSWMPPPLVVPNKTRERWDVATFLGPAAIIIRDEYIRQLLPVVDEGLELIRVSIEGEDAHIVNITALIDCLDPARSAWRDSLDQNGVPQRYAFHSRKLSYQLFKIPQTACGEVLVLEDTDGAQPGFKRRFEELGLRGIVFEEVWRD